MEIDNNIDQLLASKMDGFEAQAPAGAWDAIQANLPAAGPASIGSSLGSAPLVAAKTTSILAKLGLLVGSAVLVSTFIYFVNSNPEVIQSTPKFEIKASEKELGLTQTDKSTINAVEASELKTPAKAKGFSVPNAAPVDENARSKETPIREEKPQELVPASPSLPETVSQKEPVKPSEDRKETAIENDEEDKQTDLNEPALNNPISIEKRQPKFHNAFSPDGDGKNDTWFVELEDVSDYHLGIYNIKGQLVFESSKLSEHWNGNNDRNGETCESGNYAFIINYKYKNETKMNTSQGIIALFR